MFCYNPCGASNFLTDGRYMGITIHMMRIGEENIGTLQGTVPGRCRSILFRQNQS